MVKVLPEDTEADQRHALPLYYLKKEDEWRFEIKKVDSADYPKISKNLKSGESTLMSHDRNAEMLVGERILREGFKKGATEPWYFTHE